MFLERKFAHAAGAGQGFGTTTVRCSVLPSADWSAMPEPVYDVICSLQLLLKARRNYDHVVRDFGFSPSHGQTGLDGQIELLQREIPAVFGRYERRFSLQELDADVDEDGVAFMRASGRVRGTEGTLSLLFSVSDRRISEVTFAAETA
jgi:hypothetical protein